MADKTPTPPKVYRVMIRIDIQQITTDDATKLHAKVDDLIKDIPGATVELSVVPMLPAH
jgi:hypothetical protein